MWQRPTAQLCKNVLGYLPSTYDPYHLDPFAMDLL